MEVILQNFDSADQVHILTPACGSVQATETLEGSETITVLVKL